MDIKNLELTEQDFQMLVDGLDALPDKGMAGEMMGDIMMGLIADKGNPEAMDKIKKERDLKNLKIKQIRDSKMEDIRILQGKLIQLKRYLLQQGALKQANDILE